MLLTSDMYVPALRWRQGEYQALLRLSSAAKRRIVPFITIPEVEFDFEEWRPKKSVQEHVHPFAARYRAKWDQNPAWISIHASIVDKRMDDGRDIFAYTFDNLRTFQANAVPALSLDANPTITRSVRGVIDIDGLGAAISIRLEDLMKPEPRARIENVATSIGLALGEIDLIVDLGAPHFEPYDTFSNALIAALQQLRDLQQFRNFIMIGTAIPETFKDVAKGADQLPRRDWLFYRNFVSRIPTHMRRPVFGDYTIVHPEFKAVDMRMIKPAGKLVYTTSSSWEVRKGVAFRDYPEQMHDHCASIMTSGSFKGAHYSSGDNYIAGCAVSKKWPEQSNKVEGCWYQPPYDASLGGPLHALRFVIKTRIAADNSWSVNDSHSIS